MPNAIFPNPNAPAKAQDIIYKCEDAFPANKGDCNHFVKAVCNSYDASRGDFGDNDNADKIASVLLRSERGWLKLADAIEALDAANSGKLVLAGALLADWPPPATHGHVAVVVSSDKSWTSDNKLYPYGYWGDIAGNPQKQCQLSKAYPKAIRDNDKIYYACKIV